MAQVLKRGDSEMKVTASSFRVKEVSKDDRILRFIGSDETPDRDRDIIEVNGWDLKNFKMNPVFLWAHDYKTPPIGRAIKVVKGDGKLLFDIKFPQEGIYPFADLIYNLYKGGFMSATSVGFIPSKGTMRDDDAVKDLPEWQRGHRFSKQELLELSAVPVPSNPAATQIARSKGYMTEDEEVALNDLAQGKFAGSTTMAAYKGLEGLLKAGTEDETLFESPSAGEDDDFVMDDDSEVLFDEEAPAEEPAATEPAATEPAATEPAATTPDPAQTEPETKEPANVLVPLPVKVVTQMVEHKSWECPHCSKTIGEKSLYNDGTYFYHSPCKDAGPILLPDGDTPVTPQQESGKKPKKDDESKSIVTVNDEKGSVSIELGEGLSRSFTFDFLKQFDDSIVKAGAVLSKKNKDALYSACELIESVLTAAGAPEEPANEAGDKSAASEQTVNKDAEQTEPPAEDEITFEEETEEEIEIEVETASVEEEIEIEGSAEEIKEAISTMIRTEINTAKGIL